MKNNYNASIAKLVNDGWTLSHTATVSKYRYSGVISSMRRHNGFEFCRVHTGKTYNIQTNRNYPTLMVQVTLVFKRKINEGGIQ